VEVLKNAGRRGEAYRPLPDWIDLEPDDYWRDPSGHIRRLYRKFLSAGW